MIKWYNKPTYHAIDILWNKWNISLVKKKSQVWGAGVRVSLRVIAQVCGAFIFSSRKSKNKERLYEKKEDGYDIWCYHF